MGTLGRCLLLKVPTAGVPVKPLLCLTVERERGDGALQSWSDDAPQALRATPTREFLVFCPDHVTCHRYTYIVYFSGRGISARREELQMMRGRASHELLPAAAPTLPRNGKGGKVTSVRRPPGVKTFSRNAKVLGPT